MTIGAVEPAFAGRIVYGRNGGVYGESNVGKKVGVGAAAALSLVGIATNGRVFRNRLTAVEILVTLAAGLGFGAIYDYFENKDRAQRAGGFFG